ncbi:hypothetical protein D3C80_1554080 [compost metagenome]
MMGMAVLRTIPVIFIRELYVLGSERFSIMPFDSITNLYQPIKVVQLFCRFGQPWLRIIHIRGRAKQLIEYKIRHKIHACRINVQWPRIGRNANLQLGDLLDFACGVFITYIRCRGF